MTPEQMDRLYSYCLLSGKNSFWAINGNFILPLYQICASKSHEKSPIRFLPPYSIWQETNIIGQVFMVCGDTIPTNYPSPIYRFIYNGLFLATPIPQRGFFATRTNTHKANPYKMLPASQTAPKTPMTYHPRPIRPQTKSHA